MARYKYLPAKSSLVAKAATVCRCDQCSGLLETFSICHSGIVLYVSQLHVLFRGYCEMTLEEKEAEWLLVCCLKPLHD